MEIGGRRVLVTGAGRGIGRAVAEEFHRLGAEVIVTDRDIASARMCASGLPGAHAYALDVTDRERFGEVVASVEREHGPIDILINNAGVMALGRFHETEHQDRAQIEVNLMGVIHGFRAVLPRMTERGSGHVVNIASAAGRVPLPGGAVYSATKHAVVGLSESVRIELRGTGVMVSHVLPTLVETEMGAGLGRMLFPPPLHPSEVARATAQLVQTGTRAAFVPEVMRLAPAVLALFPFRWTDALQRWLGVYRVADTADPGARRSYDSRAFGDSSPTPK